MKYNRTKKCCGLAVATLLLGGANLTFAQTADVTLDTFDAGLGGGGINWGSSTLTWDGSEGNPAGSALITSTFGSGSDTPFMPYWCIGGGNPWWNNGTIDFSLYKSIDFDIKYDPTSDITVAQFNDLSTWPTTLTNSLGQTVFQSWAPAGYLSGSTAGIDLYLCGPGGNQNSPFIGNTNIPAVAASGWVHMSFPINPATAGLAGQSGITIHKWINQQWGILNPVTTRVWIDNIVIKGTAAPPPPPTTSLSPAQAGLNLFAGTSGGNDRENIRTTNALTANYSWVGRGNAPVSYTFTITNYPGASTPYFMINSFLVPVPYDRPSGTNGTVGGEASPDWNEATCIFMDFEEYNDGSGDWRFRYKTNSPSSNGANNSYYADVQAELRDYSGVKGTWTLTFVNNTNVTMTSPSGLSNNFVFSADKVSWWADNSGNALPMYYYIGCRGNGAGAGLGAVLSRATIQGSVDPLDDNFLADTALDPTKWEVIAAYAPSIQLVPATPKPVYWADWTLPAGGFSLENSPSLTGPWIDCAMNPLAFAGCVKGLVKDCDLPSGMQGYFRLVKRVASQLQVLLPGETNAPGTVSGKTGTPVAQTTGVPFDVVVNVCDADWHIVTSSSDIVAITSSDTSAWLPGNAALVNGTVTITGNFFFGTAGTWTVTATDVSPDNTISAGTSSPVTAQ